MKIKFTVFKNDDVEKYLSSDQKILLADIAKTICNGRLHDNRRPGNSYLVINTDECYAKDVIKIMGRAGHWHIPFQESQTNYDKIKSMTVEEMAELFMENEEESTNGELWATKSNVIRWLESEVTE